MMQDKDIMDMLDLLNWLKAHTMEAEHKHDTNTREYVQGYIDACERIRSRINYILGYKDDGINRAS